MYVTGRAIFISEIVVTLLITFLFFIVVVDGFVAFFLIFIRLLIAFIFIRLQLTSVLVANISTETSLLGLAHVIEFFSNSLVIIIVLTVEDLLVLGTSVLILELVDNLLLLCASLVILHVVHVKFMFQIVNISELFNIDGVETLELTL